MGIFNVLLVVQNKILVIGAADKTDDKMILYHNLSKLHSLFVKKYNSMNELDNWMGELVTFRGFNEIARKELKEGRISEVKVRIPILKIFKKSFLSSFDQNVKKELKLKEETYKNIRSVEEKPLWLKEKTLPKQIVAQDFLSPEQYKVAHSVNGYNTIEEIATEVEMPVEKIYKILKILEDLGLLSYIELV